MWGYSTPHCLYRDSLILTLTVLTALTRLIMFFILLLLHTITKIGMYGLLYILTYSL